MPRHYRPRRSWPFVKSISAKAHGEALNASGSSASMKDARLLLIGVVGSIVLAIVTLSMADASLVGGRYGPVGHDAFYHSSRILEAVQSGSVSQFDVRMHAPAGDWVTWPWAYDATIATIVRAVHGVTAADVLTVAAHVPIALGLVTLWLVLSCAVQLRLPAGLVLAAVLCFAFHAFTQYQFGVGAFDHHGAEQLAVLAALASGLAWWRRPASVARAAPIGLILGLAPGIHAALVVLQLPVLMSAVLAWWRHEPPPPPATMGLAAGLLGGALAVLLPAATFWQGRFDLFYLSGLQLYVTLVTAGFAVTLSRIPRSGVAIVGLLVAAAIATVPLLATLVFSASFVTGDLPAIAQIDEIRSPFALLSDPKGVQRLDQVYTLLIWLAPLTLIAALVMAFREADPVRRYFWCWAAFGLAMVLLQQRLASLGVVFLYLTLLVLAADAIRAHPSRARWIAAGVAASLLVAYFPTIRYQLFAPKIPAMDEQFTTLRPLLPALIEACRRRPGVVLASPGDGHLVRYYTKCAVVSNNFRLTAVDLERIQTSLDLIGGHARDLSDRAPYVDYVLARLIAPAESPDPVLFAELLNPVADESAGFRTIVEAGVAQPNGTRFDYFGLFEVPRNQSPASSPGT
jgi:hypothetical protein